MINRKHKIINTLLIFSVSAVLLSACDSYLPRESLVNSLPTTAPSETTAANSETTAETTVQTTEATESDETFETAEDVSGIDTDFVRTVADIPAEMMDVDYWIDEDDNKILMTAEQIEEFNYRNRVHEKTGDGVQMPYFDEFGETLDGKILRAFLEENKNSAPKDPSRYYLDGNSTTRSYWNNLIALSNIDAVPDKIEVRYGFTVKRMTLRLYPTEDRVFDGSSDKYFDIILYSECMPYMPVYVLHESSDGEYLYVVFDSFAAWVRKDAVALCKSKEDWLARQNPEHWLTVTAREIRLGDDPYVEVNRDLVLPMGTKMQLIEADDAPTVINQRSTYGNYVVKVPTRGSDGYVKDEYVLIPVSDDVTIGYLPLTPANVVRQAFKLLGDRYGWGGDLRANDCTGITREIYRCFGILLPRVGQSDSKGIYRVDLTGMSEEDKLAEIDKLEPGSLISFPGHMTIYLGTVDGIPYVISATGTFIEPAGGSTAQIHPETVIISSLYVRNRKLTPWIHLATTALTMKPSEFG